MDFILNTEELALLYGLPHIQQLLYLRGIRPYMDVKTGLVGIKRRISYQSISEQLYVEPHQGIKSQSFSRDQLRRAVSGLARAGVITVQSEGMQLILKCESATRDYSISNKAAINPPRKSTTNQHEKSLVGTRFLGAGYSKSDIAESPKATIPLKDNNYIYLLSQFEKFWSAYPEKKSRTEAWQTFQWLNPDDGLFNKIMSALCVQIKHHQQKQVHGVWVPPWKYPANWLSKKAWEDEVTMEKKQEIQDAARRQNTRNESGRDPFWTQDIERETPRTNVIEFKAR